VFYIRAEQLFLTEELRQKLLQANNLVKNRPQD
jgi:hypothetical protein